MYCSTALKLTFLDGGIKQDPLAHTDFLMVLHGSRLYPFAAVNEVTNSATSRYY